MCRYVFILLGIIWAAASDGYADAIQGPLERSIHPAPLEAWPQAAGAPRAKVLLVDETATVGPGEAVEFTTVLTSVWAHSRNTFDYVFSETSPMPSFMSYSVDGVSARTGYDYAHVVGGEIYADDNTFLGVVSTNQFASDSILNFFGAYGSEFSSTSIRNTLGRYGDAFSRTSAYNTLATAPPVIYVNNRATCYLSKNTLKLPRCDPNELFTYLSGEAPGGFPTVRHTIQVDATAPAGTYEFPIGFGFYSEGDGTTLVGTDVVWFTITVTSTASNAAPEFSSIGDQSVAEGELIEFAVRATDADGDELTFSATMSPLPEGPTFSADSGLFRWRPGFDQSGEYEITFQVDDGQGGADTATIVLTVTNTNRPPVLASVADLTIEVGTGIEVALSATDPDQDGFTFSGRDLPVGAVVDGATLTWTPSPTQLGIFEVAVVVTDDHGATDLQTLTIEVTGATGEVGGGEVALGGMIESELVAPGVDGIRSFHFAVPARQWVAVEMTADAYDPYVLVYRDGETSPIASNRERDRSWARIERLLEPGSYRIDCRTRTSRDAPGPFRVTLSPPVDERLTYINDDYFDVGEEVIRGSIDELGEGGRRSYLLYVPSATAWIDLRVESSDLRPQIVLHHTVVPRGIPVTRTRMQASRADVGEQKAGFSRFIRGRVYRVEVGDFRNEATGDFTLTVSRRSGPPAKLLSPVTEMVAALEPNYPNPFNGETTFRFSLMEGQQVDLSVYNLLGQEVSSIVSGFRGAGFHSMTWNGRGHDSTPVASGVYILQLRTIRQTESRPITIIR